MGDKGCVYEGVQKDLAACEAQCDKTKGCTWFTFCQDCTTGANKQPKWGQNCWNWAITNKTNTKDTHCAAMDSKKDPNGFKMNWTSGMKVATNLFNVLY